MLNNLDLRVQIRTRQGAALYFIQGVQMNPLTLKKKIIYI